MAGMTVSSCAMLREPRSAVMGCAMVHCVGLSFVVNEVLHFGCVVLCYENMLY